MLITSFLISFYVRLSILLLIIINLLGFASLPLGYGEQLINTNPLLWLFVPDCQLSVLFFAIGLITNNDELLSLGVLSVIKYGFWTIIVLLINYSFFVNVFWLLFTPHLFMITEGFLFFNRIRFSWITALFFVINDLSDYLFNTHPFIPNHLLLMSIITPLISLILLLVSWHKNRLAV